MQRVPRALKGLLVQGVADSREECGHDNRDGATGAQGIAGDRGFFGVKGDTRAHGVNGRD